ncbi:MAG: cytochrome c peroxidase, partial [Glaciecola sp.]
FLSEGGSATLETQIAIPFQEHNEFDLNILLAAERLNEKPELVKLSQSAYNRAIDPFVITRAIATFERSLLTGNSDYDRYYLQDDSSAMNQSELNGLSIFNGTGKCIACHIGFNFTTYAFENNGLYEVYEDSGRFRLTEVDEDMATFKVPTLRNVEFTAPYMHDGSKETLEDVVEHYSTGIKDHPNTNTILENLNLTEQEKMDLVNFLKSLSDFDFINDPKFQP